MNSNVAVLFFSFKFLDLTVRMNDNKHLYGYLQALLIIYTALTTQMPLDHMHDDSQGPTIHDLRLNEAVNMAKNLPLWRLLTVSGSMHS